MIDVIMSQPSVLCQRGGVFAVVRDSMRFWISCLFPFVELRCILVLCQSRKR